VLVQVGRTKSSISVIVQDERAALRRNTCCICGYVFYSTCVRTLIKYKQNDGCLDGKNIKGERMEGRKRKI
jgi:hypothetical protein